MCNCPDEELWQTGKPEERVKLLQKLRQTEPIKAREWLQQTWEQENAANKVELLKVLRINSSPADLPWLESLQGEKGQKVKDEVLILLKQIPGSSIIKKYEEVLSTAVVLKKEKALFGMMNKTSIQLQLPDNIDESIFKSGIEKLAGQKSTISDNEFVIFQLISFVPPVFWETNFDANPGQVVEYFEKHASFLLSALSAAVARFKETTWIPHFFYHDDFYADFAALLPIPEREKYFLKFVDVDAPNKQSLSFTAIDIIQHASKLTDEWGLAFALQAIKFMANNPYQYNRGFYNQNIKLIPVSMLGQLDKMDSKDQKPAIILGKKPGASHQIINLKAANAASI